MKLGKYGGQLWLPLFILLLYIVSGSICAYAMGNSILGTMITNVVFLIGFAAYYHKRRSFEERHKLSIFVLLGLTVVVWYITGVTGTFIADLVPESGLLEADMLSDMDAFLYLILAAFVAPVVEEFLFRRLLFRSFLNVLPRYLAYMLPAFLFAATHGTIPHLYTGFVCGLFFALLYEYTGTLGVSVMVHFMYNILMLIGGAVPIPEFVFHPVTLGVLNVILFVMLGCILYKIQDRNRNRAEDA